MSSAAAAGSPAGPDKVIAIVPLAAVGESFYTPSGAEDLPEVSAIIDEVRRRGDRALKDCCLRFDGVIPEHFRVSRESLGEALAGMAAEARISLTVAARNIRRFARRQFKTFRDFELEMAPGVRAGQRITPLDRVGVYVPGGNFPLVSSLLMGAIPAQVAGVTRIVICTPPDSRAEVPSMIRAAAALIGVEEVYALGGVQAIAALAFGTESVPPVDKIVGPGNRFVTAAKKAVYGRVGIDFVAGPSEVMIIADAAADPAFVAADLLAQAEHDAAAVAVLVTDAPALALRVEAEIRRRLERLSTAAIARRSLAGNGMIIIVDSMDQAVEVANRKAPEHLELQVNNPETMIGKLKNFGSLFVGPYSAEVLGDYSSGINHVLPTGGAARFSGGLGVKDFLKIQTVLRTTPGGMKRIGPAAAALAALEGLDAHRQAVEARGHRKQSGKKGI